MNLKTSSLFLFGILLIANCAEVNYIGKTFEPTQEIDVFFDDKLVDREYTIIGHAIGSAAWGLSNEKIQAKLIETAQRKGAHAIIITGIGKDTIVTGEGTSTDETQINAIFIRYDDY